ncbi:MAG: hypothetical protein AAGN35_25480 [Bacteroidota bacterium]
MKDTTWDPEVAAPIAKANITVPDVLGEFDDDDIITIDPATGLLALKYFDEVFLLAGEDALVIDRQTGTLPVPVTPQNVLDVTNNGTAIDSVTIPFPLSFPSGEAIDIIEFAESNLGLTFAQQTSYTTLVGVRIDNLTLNGAPFSLSSIDPSVTNTIDTDLNGYILDMSANPNTINVVITYRYSGTGTPGPGFSIAADLSRDAGLNEGPRYRRIDGDFGQQNITIDQDQVGVRIFDNELGGIIEWDSAIVRGFISNSFGMPIDLNVNPFRAVNSETMDSLDINGFGGITVPAAVGLVAGRDSFELVGNNGGANVNDIANLNPDLIRYGGDVQINPGTGPFNNFALDTSTIRLGLAAILPFDGKAIDFSRGTVADVDIFPLDDDIEEVVSVTIRITIDNGFPADAYIQAYYCDSNLVDLDSLPISQQLNSVIDSAFATGRSQVFASPTPDGTGFVDQNNKVRSTLDIVLTREQLENLEANNMRKIAIRGWVETFNMGQTRVKIFETYSLDLWVGLKAQARVKVEF